MAAVVDIEMPVVVKRVAEQIERGLRHLSPVESVAGVICSSGVIAEGLAALPVLEQLRARHTARSWGDGPGPQAVVTVCAACNVAWPCGDAEILGVAAAAPASPAQVRDRYWLCGDDCTTDCGVCKGTGPR